MGSLVKVSALTELKSTDTSHLSLCISWNLIGKSDVGNLVSTVGGTLSLRVHVPRCLICSPVGDKSVF